MATNEIVVGIDGSDGSVGALQWAVDHAARTGAPVVAVHAWEFPYASDVSGMTTMPDWAYMADGARATVDRVVEKVTLPEGVHVEVEVVEGSGAGALIERAEGAALLVVGARGRGGFLSLLLGSVATQCVNHARVPVVVIPSAARVARAAE
jgi:nucleotide-binding universal stress UspA family protein